MCPSCPCHFLGKGRVCSLPSRVPATSKSSGWNAISPCTPACCVTSPVKRWQFKQVLFCLPPGEQLLSGVLWESGHRLLWGEIVWALVQGSNRQLHLLHCSDVPPVPFPRNGRVWLYWLQIILSSFTAELLPAVFSLNLLQCPHFRCDYWRSKNCFKSLFPSSFPPMSVPLHDNSSSMHS